MERRRYDDGMFIDGFSDDALYYQLTPEGGAAWEAFARPRWDHFIGDFGSHTEPEEPGQLASAEATCADRRHLLYYLQGVHWFGWEIDPKAVVWDMVQPWEATYWKTLPSAHRVRFSILSMPEEHPDYYGSQMWFHSLAEWYPWRS